MIAAPKGYDLRELVDMLAERRPRNEKERILLAISALRKDDRDAAAEDAHLLGDLSGVAYAARPTTPSTGEGE